MLVNNTCIGCPYKPDSISQMVKIFKLYINYMNLLL